MKLSSFNAFRIAGKVAMGGLFALAIASCGGGGGSAGSVPGVTPVDPSVVVGSVTLIFSTPSLPSSGAAGTEVTVTALVKTATNTAINNAAVTFGADSGALANIQTKTDASGKATALLSTSGDHTNRQITVTASAGTTATGIKTATGTVSVVGAGVTAVGVSTIALGGTGDFTATVTDTGTPPIPIANVPVTISSLAGNSFVVTHAGIGGTATAPRTDSTGQVSITVTASKSGSDTITFTSQGAKYDKKINIDSSLLNVSITGLPYLIAGTAVLDSNGVAVTSGNTTNTLNPSPLSTCLPISSTYTIGGVAQTGTTINLSTSRGQLYTDSACSTALSPSTVAVTAGNSTPVYLKSDTAGDATVTAIAAGGLSAQATAHFLAPLDKTKATINFQANPAVIGPNTGASTLIQKSTLIAVVRDGGPFNNFVEDAAVEFTIVNDSSGGSLSNPQVGTTAADGSVRVSYISGGATTQKGGVQINATIQGTATTQAVALTVAKASLFIAAGTGNTLGVPNDTTYSQNFSVFVTDASGNPVPGVTITAAVTPTRYFKGTYTFTTVWSTSIVASCSNEDNRGPGFESTNLNGILDQGEDFNGNGVLDPGIPLNVTSSGTTDASGAAVITILYPKDRGGWTEVTMEIRGSVAGTEATYTVQPYTLPVLGSDLSSQTSEPPGFISPYGVNSPCSVPN